MKLLPRRDKTLLALINIFTEIAEYIYRNKEQGTIYQESFVYNLPIRINIEWGTQLLESDDDEN